MRTIDTFRGLVLGVAALGAGLGSLEMVAGAQDARQVTEPVMASAVCSVVGAGVEIAGGAPVAEGSDTARIQAALDGCAAGQAVELAGSGGRFGFVSGALRVPAGVTLMLDGGVTLFASRNAGDFQAAGGASEVDRCGASGTRGNGCLPLISVASGSGVMGYGVIDGRGDRPMFGSGGGWWNGAGAGAGGSNSINRFALIGGTRADNVTLYKVTLENAPGWSVAWQGTGLTAWGVRTAAASMTSGTGGIQADGRYITIADSVIAVGGEDVAVGSRAATVGVTLSRVTTYAGQGIVVGGKGGVTNLLASRVSVSAGAGETASAGLRLVSSEGAAVRGAVFDGICGTGVRQDVEVNSAGGGQIADVTLRNVHFLTEGAFTVAGRDANAPVMLTLDNVVLEGLKPGDVTGTQFASLTLSGGTVFPGFLQSLAGAGVSYTGSAAGGSAGAYDCTGAFQALRGEMYAAAGLSGRAVDAGSVAGGNFRLNAVVEPAASQMVPGGAVQFYEGGTLVGAGLLGANGTNETLAGMAVTNAATGAHTYTAMMGGVKVGSLAVTVVPAAAASTTTTLATITTPITVGAAVTLTATVTSGATPAPVTTGTVNFLNGTTVIGTGTLDANGKATASLPTGTAGTETITAMYVGTTAFATSTSAAQTVTVAAPAVPFSISATPTAVSLKAGATTNVMVTLTPGAQTSGLLNFNCQTPVAYVQCAFPSPISLAPTPQVFAVAITISPTVTRLEPFGPTRGGGAWYALLVPAGLLGLCGMRRRGGWMGRGLLAVMVCVGMGMGATGCAKPAPKPPAGVQTVTLTATQGTYTAPPINIVVTILD